MTRVLLTGAGGFVGRQVSKALMARGFEVYGALIGSAFPAALARAVCAQRIAAPGSPSNHARSA